MRRICTGFLAVVLAAVWLAGCKAETDPTETLSAQTQQTTPSVQPTQPQPTDSPETVASEVPIGQADTYWVAAQWDSGDGEGPCPFEPEFWSVDLIIRADGTARLRDIHEEIYLQDDSRLKMVWEQTPEGRFLFYSPVYTEPVLQAVWEEGVLSAQYEGVRLTMKQGEMPRTVGQLYSPAELEGTWLLVSGETEGEQWEAMPNELTSIIFDVTSYDGPLVLVADMEERDPYGEPVHAAYAQPVEVLPEALYEGCGNEAWCVRIGEASGVDANGDPLETEIYGTLLNRNTLLLQRYYTLDGAPAVSYQTYLRLPEVNSWMSHEAMELELTTWTVTDYVDEAGEALPLPAELEDFSVTLESDLTCWISCGGSVGQGSWMAEKGGVLLVRGPEDAAEPLWFGGTVSGYWIGGTAVYQMSLYYRGGILRLTVGSYG